jgi:hypothetical protein
MSMLCIYNPYILPDFHNVIEFVLDYRDSIAIGRGSKEFMQVLLRDIGVEADVLKWSVQAFRSNYYSELVGTDDWRDNWILNWKVRVETAEVLDPLPMRDFPFIETDAIDSTWVSTKMPGNDTIVNCLVISDFDREAELEEAQNVIAETVSNGKLKELREKYSAELPTFSRSEILGEYKQLQVDLSKFPGSFFAQGADYAEEVIELCRKMNGTVNFLDRV